MAITLANIDFTCPYCKQKYSDSDDKYLDRCNKNKSGFTSITCSRCNEKFGMTYDYTEGAIGFELGKNKKLTQ